MTAIRLEHITTPHCLRGVDLSIAEGEVVALLGATGAGKSTLVNVIADLIEYTGDVYFGDVNVNSLSTRKRNVGYVFQDVCLFPHLSVFENVAFGLKARDFDRGLIDEKVTTALGLLSIDHLKARYPKDLSGGEKQRVGLARSIVTEPRVLILDEPLSSLDPCTASEILKELKALHGRLGLTMVYVTHNLAEAQELADRIVMIAEGEIKLSAPVGEVSAETVRTIWGQRVFARGVCCRSAEGSPVG